MLGRHAAPVESVWTSSNTQLTDDRSSVIGMYPLRASPKIFSAFHRGYYPVDPSSAHRGACPSSCQLWSKGVTYSLDDADG